MNRWQVLCVCALCLCLGISIRPHAAGAPVTNDEDNRALFSAIRDGELAAVQRFLENKEIVNATDKS
jgi:hypothetical protein